MVRTNAGAAFIGWALMALLLLLCATSTWAADIYQCKGANGVVAFQNEPCQGTQKIVAHGTYKLEPDSPQIVDPYEQSQVLRPSVGTVNTLPQRAYDSAAPPRPVAYQCTAGPRTWVQYSRCPATYMQSVPVDVDGYTDTGQHFSGASGTAEIEAPVQQQSMDRNALCGALGDRASHIPHSGQSDVYERNVAKRKYCGQ